MKVTQLPAGDEWEGFSRVVISGEIKGGGKFSIELDPLGQPAQDLEKLHIEFGEKTLAAMAKSVAAHHLEALTGGEARTGKTRLAGAVDGAFRFHVEGDRRAVDVAIGADGILEPGAVS
jgi:hypothetical protein